MTQELVLNKVGQAVMSSLEIAELCNKEHNHVMRDIRNMLEALELGESIFGHSYLSKQNKLLPCFSLNKELTITLVSGYELKFRNAIVKRWMELEADVSVQTLPTTYLDALKQLVASVEQNQNLMIELSVAAPKIEFVDNYVDRIDAKGFRQVAKLIKSQSPESTETLFRKFLSKNNIMYKLNGEWVAYAQYLNQEYFCVKVGVDDKDRTYNQTLFTPKGILWVTKKYTKWLSKLNE